MIESIGKPNEERDVLDFYATNPRCVKDLIELECLENLSILENSAGNGHIAKTLKENNNDVYSIDIVERDFKIDNINNFLELKELDKHFDCAVFNPPFKLLKEFILHTFNFTDVMYVFCRIQTLETVKRYEQLFSKGYLEKCYVYVKRQSCIQGDKKEEFGTANSMVYCWLKFNKNNKSKCILDWIMPK